VGPSQQAWLILDGPEQTSRDRRIPSGHVGDDPAQRLLRQAERKPVEVPVPDQIIERVGCVFGDRADPAD
jgi:hypothetical protein